MSSSDTTREAAMSLPPFGEPLGNFAPGDFAAVEVFILLMPDPDGHMVCELRTNSKDPIRVTFAPDIHTRDDVVAALRKFIDVVTKYAITKYC